MSKKCKDNNKQITSKYQDARPSHYQDPRPSHYQDPRPSHYQDGLLAHLFNGPGGQNGTVRIDRNIYQIIVLLNHQGYKTTSSCQEISSGIMAGLAWVQFENISYFRRLLETAWMRCNGLYAILSDSNRVMLVCKPTFQGNMKLDMYFQIHDIPTLEHHLRSLVQFPSKL